MLPGRELDRPSGLGAAALRARAGHARTMGGAAGGAIESVFPSTTAAALATLTTGVSPGQHGLVGYSVLDAEHDRVVVAILRGDKTGAAVAMRAHIELVRGEYEIYAVSV